ncbi:type II secretion system inner membrane protein GspF [Thauera sp. CAU 1555]|uniref:Type II secretion system inner membrane protein GspF n=2 Tax=Thauera sedimentorum TaxID=2767595 RepID=A0ABR9B9H8_9RHOO|nr:type II secretion system inner membrane protein GspF [Thauera sedimentorum]MBD8502609.1 type II secretion system inner membrane protein GspF [Thauera sedimentorum]
MAAFRYRALDAEGRETAGVIEADSSRGARALLRERKLFPLEVASMGGVTSASSARQRLKEMELVLLSRQWATLLAAGMTVEQALVALIEQAEHESTRQLLSGVRSEILAGHSLRAALDRFPIAFPAIYRASVAAGEKSGQLALVMEQLAGYLERRLALRQKTQHAFLYPAIVACVALLVVVGLMTYVVPQVVTVFQQGRQELPLLTRLMIHFSSFLRDWGWAVLIVLAGSGLGFAMLLRDKAVRRGWHALLLRLPLIGRHLRVLDATRFASTLSILAGSGVPLLAALEAGREVTERLPVQDAIRDATERVREGQSLSKALASVQVFPPLLIHMIASGEATGRLDELLERAARLQQQELENRVAVLTSLLEPVLLLVMGGVVLLIVLAVMQPIVEINTMLR